MSGYFANGQQGEPQMSGYFANGQQGEPQMSGYFANGQGQLGTETEAKQAGIRVASSQVAQG